MASQEEERILSIRVKYQDAINGILQYQKQVDELKGKQQALKEELKDGTIGVEEYNATVADIKVRMAEAKDGIRILEKEARNNLKTQRENEGSLKSLRAELSNATKAYDEMSREEREGAKGKELQEHINTITNELKEAEEQTQRFYRNVGNYEESVKKALAGLSDEVKRAKQKYDELVKTQGEHAKATKKAKKELDDAQLSFKFASDEAEGLNESVLGFVMAGNPWAMTAAKFVQQLGSIRNGFTLAKTGAQMLSKQLLALMANPIVAFLALAATAISVLVSGIKSSEENMNRWSIAMAPLGRLLAMLQNVIQGVCGWILSAVEAGGKMLGWISSMCESLPVLGKSFKEYNDRTREAIELEKEKIAIEKQGRKDEVQNAKDQLEVAQMRQQAKDREKFTAEERLKFVERANQLEEQQAKRNVELAERKLKALQIESEWADNDADTNEELARLEADVYNKRKEYFAKTMELLEQTNTLKNEMAAEEKAQNEAAKKAAEEAVKIRQERTQKEEEAVRQAEDAMLSLVRDGIEKQRQQITLQYDREIADLKKKLAEEKNLTEKAKDAILQTIKSKEQMKNQELARLNDDELQQAIDKEQKRIALLLEGVKSGSEQEYQLKLAQLQKQEEAEMMAMEREVQSVEEREAMKLAIRQKYNLLNDELIAQHNNDIIQKEQEAIRLEYETKIAEAGNNEYAVLQLKVQQKEAELAAIKQLEGESDAEYHLRVVEAGNAVLDAKRELAAKEIEIEETKQQALSDIMGGIGQLADALGEKNTAFAKLSKVLALAEIAINTGKALAAGIAQAQSVPFPGNIAAIATTVATILANIATATKTVNSAKFATGGLVEGEGTATSDSIPAMLSNGESVMTAAATSMFSPMLSAFNQMGGGVPINVLESNNSAMGEEMLANAVARGMQLAPRPVVSVEEFNTVSKRVDFVDNIGNI